MHQYFPLLNLGLMSLQFHYNPFYSSHMLWSVVTPNLPNNFLWHNNGKGDQEEPSSLIDSFHIGCVDVVIAQLLFRVADAYLVDVGPLLC